MYPTLFGFLDTYTVFVVLGVASAFIIFLLYLNKKLKKSRNEILDLTLCLLFAVAIGLISAILFQNLYNFINNPKEYKWEWAMTFIGGVVGGVIAFFFMYFLFYVKRHPKILKDLLVIAPGSITLAHAIGRIGCLMGGCCYGRATEEWYGIYFQTLGYKAVPIQLYESLFLFALTGVLLFLAFKFEFLYTMPIYMFSYSIWRFVIEFFRDDDRGAFIGSLSPSQFWCILIFIGSFVLFYILYRKRESTKW